MFQADVIRIAKRNNISITRLTEKEIEFYEKDKEKMWEFVREVEEMNSKLYKHNLRFIELSRIEQDVDIKGNTLEGSKSLYLVDEDYYKSIVAKLTDRQLSIL